MTLPAQLVQLFNNERIENAEHRLHVGLAASGEDVRAAQRLRYEEALMKRFHVHIAVEKLDESIRFYSTLFGTEPTVTKADYAKWMLEDPRLNFAISQRGHATGVSHLGFQIDDDAALKDMRTQLAAADSAMVEETGAACCYAQSDKYWVTDPSGIAWETFHTLGAIPVFGRSVKRK